MQRSREKRAVGLIKTNSGALGIIQFYGPSLAPSRSLCVLCVALLLRFAASPTPQLHFSFAMYEDFVAVDRWSRQPIHCLYQALIVAIATRHADAVDIKFLAGGRPVWIALPHPAWVEYKNRTGQIITDPLAVQVAGHFLKSAIESGEDGGREMYSLTVAETLQHLDAVLDEVNVAKPRA